MRIWTKSNFRDDDDSMMHHTVFDQGCRVAEQTLPREHSHHLWHVLTGRRQPDRSSGASLKVRNSPMRSAG